MFWTIEVDGVKSLNYAQNFHEMVKECNESFEFIYLSYSREYTHATFFMPFNLKKHRRFEDSSSSTFLNN